MKVHKIFINLSLLSMLALLLTPLSVAQAECSWGVKTVSTTYSFPGSSGVTNSKVECGILKETNKTELCSSIAKPTYSANSSQSAVCCCTEETVLVEPPKQEKPIFIMPEFQIPIPTVALTASSAIEYVANLDGSYMVQIPWIGQYIAGVYQYGLAAAGILAAVILMASGLMWLVSGGDVSKISQAKELIVGSIIGIVILSSSYIILTQINPDLVTYKPISIGTVANKGYDIPDASETELGSGINPYQEGCDAAKKGDLSICRGYGDKMPEGLVVSDGVYMDTTLATKYQAARECVKDKNGGSYPFFVLVGWRSATDQIRMKEEWTKAGKPENAATPCCSRHGSGRAIDLKVGTPASAKSTSWAFNTSSHLTECMNAQGLTAPLTSSPNEPWHWQ